MILQEFFEAPLSERVHDIVYHATSLYNAVQILKSRKFQLSSVLGAEYEQSLQPPGHPYFFSTTRSRSGSYHAKFPGSGQVVLKLDGSWFNRHYQSGPVDYWGDAARHQGHSEQEDRVFSRKSTIPADNILEAHVYLSVRHPRAMDGPLLRKFLILCKQKQLPVWVYNQASAWITQNKARALSIQEILPLAQGEIEPQKTWPSRNYIAPWLELWYKNSTDQLSDRAKQEKYNLVRTHWIQDRVQSLSTDLSNERRPSSRGYQKALRLIDLLTRKKMSVKDFVLSIKLKWEIIDLAGKHKVSVDQVKQAVNTGTQAELDNARGDRSLAQGYAINNLSYDIEHYNNPENLTESQSAGDVLANFLKFACAKLRLKKLPHIKFVAELSHTETEHPTFGYFDAQTDQIRVRVTGRHPLDIMRTLAHELVHYRQRLSQQLDGSSGSTGSAAENQANAQAGILMRQFADQNPDYFALHERQMNEIQMVPDLSVNKILNRYKQERYNFLIKNHAQDEFEIDDITVYRTQAPGETKTFFRLLGKKNDSGKNKIVLVVEFWETKIRRVPALTIASTWVSRQEKGRNLAARLYVAASRRYNRAIVSDDMQTQAGSKIWTQGLPKLGIKPQAYEMGEGLVPGKDPYNNPADDVRWIFHANRKITSSTFTANSRIRPQKDDDEEDFWS